MHPQHPHVALVILNWNGFEDTLECLDSVFKNTYPNYSIYLVDNASKDDELSRIKRYLALRNQNKKSFEKNPKVYCIQNKENLGFAEGNNVAIRTALRDGADYIFTLNNDTEVDPKFLSEAIKALSLRLPAVEGGVEGVQEGDDVAISPHSARKTGIIATKMVNYYNRKKLDNIGHDLLTTGDTVPKGRNESTTSYNLPPTTFGSCAGASLYSASMLKEIGLFDKEFFLNYEDADLSLRAIVRGYSIAYCPTSIVYHKINQSIKKIKNTGYRIRSQRNQLWAYLHNAPAFVILLNLPWIILRDLLVIILSFITLRWTITKIFICSRYEVLKSLPKILKKRKTVQKHRKISALDFWFRQKSFLTTYFKYFWQIVVKRRNSVME
jgi:GT2 family glycosyltransferase